LLGEWDRCRFVWNQLVAESRDKHRTSPGEPFGYKAQDRLLTEWRAEHAWLTAGSSVAQQQTVRDFAAARTKALKDRKSRLPVARRRGLPRFKKRDRALPSMNYTLRGFSLKPHFVTGKLALRLPGGVLVPVVWSRDLPSDPRSARVSRDALGHWWVSLVVERRVEPLPKTSRGVGIDWGVKAVAIATDPAFDLPHSQHGARAARALARYQRAQARRKPKPGQPASHGYRRASRRVARLHSKIACQRRDEARKWALSVVRAHDLIGVEDFKPKFLAKSRMARKAADGRIAAAKAALADAAIKHDRELVLISPAYTTMTCSNPECGARAKHRLPLSQRTFVCESCGHTKDRDRNAASTVLARAGLGPAGVEDTRPAIAATRSGLSEPGIPRR
jgi:putative transposase